MFLSILKFNGFSHLCLFSTLNSWGKNTPMQPNKCLRCCTSICKWFQRRYLTFHVSLPVFAMLNCMHAYNFIGLIQPVRICRLIYLILKTYQNNHRIKEITQSMQHRRWIDFIFWLGLVFHIWIWLNVMFVYPVWVDICVKFVANRSFVPVMDWAYLSKDIN